MKQALGGKVEKPASSAQVQDQNSEDDRAAREAKEQEERAAKAARMKKALGGKAEEPAPSQPAGGRRANAAPSGPDSIKPFSLDDNSDEDRAAREAKEQEERAAKAARMKQALGGKAEEPAPSQP